MMISLLALWGLSLSATSLASVQENHLIHASGRMHHGTLRGHAGCSKSGQLYRPTSYIPSSFERDWSERTTESNEDACGFIRSNTPRVDAWLAAIKEFYSLPLNNLVAAVDFIAEVPLRNESFTANSPENIFSRMVYENICPGEFFGMRKEIAVEPLVGHMRHPYGLKECVPLGKKEHSIVDLNYFLVAPWAAVDFNAIFPGDRYLFDLGSSKFAESMQFLTTRYQQAGIFFNQIWAWEAAAQDPKQYWDAVPDAYKQRLHFYNTPITDDFRAASHPLNMIRGICEPGDFIVVKLDIDNGPLESAIMAEIAADPRLRHCISEMYYEQHYDHADMGHYPGDVYDTSLSDVFRSFTKEREAGLLLHYWP